MKATILTLFLLASISGSALAQSTKAPDCVATQGPLPEKWEGTAFSIDGDTLAGVGLKPHIRIWGIQAPELRDKDKQETSAGMRARSFLEGVLTPLGHQVACRPTKFDRYCRIVAQCTVMLESLPDKKPFKADIGEIMVSAGYAYGFYLDDALPWDAKRSVVYAESEDRARNDKRGLWPIWHGEK